MDTYDVRIANDFTDGQTGLNVFSASQNQEYAILPGEAWEFKIPLVDPGVPAYFLRVKVLPAVENLPNCRVKLPSLGKLTFIPEIEIVTSRFEDETGSFLVIPGGPPQWELHITGPMTQFPPGDGEEGPDNISVGENGDGG